MTDPSVQSENTPLVGQVERSADERRRHTAKRFAAERRFKYSGLACVMVAIGFLVLLLSTIIGNAIPAFTIYNLNLPVNLEKSVVDQDAIEKANYRSIANKGLASALPFVKGRKNKRALRKLISSGAPVIFANQVLADRDLLGTTSAVALPLSDTVDLYLKGFFGTLRTTEPVAAISVSGTKGDVEIDASSPVFEKFAINARAFLKQTSLKLESEATALERSVAAEKSNFDQAQILIADGATSDERRERAVNDRNNARDNIDALVTRIESLRTESREISARAAAKSGLEPLTEQYPSLLLKLAGGVVKITAVDGAKGTGEVLIPLNKSGAIEAGEWSLNELDVPEAERKLSDKEVVWTEHLKSAGMISKDWNSIFFSRGASREAEMAGIWGAVVGSFLTMVVTLLLSFPIGVSAAIYLEEFAPKNRLTDVIEVNINNLAAVPSIVFGLLGLAVFLNFAEFPRSAPIVGGMVLALMTLPTIIIASRAALKAVPPSIREAALGVGASRIQAVFHHVLPLAMPGMLTGTIIGMAQALGETAPLLMIGMVAFIVDIPGGFSDPSTVLPVQIYMWADFPEVAFQQKTAAAILILLAFLVFMNAIAVVLRKKFERRW